MSKADMIDVEGVVTEVLPNTMFRVDIGKGEPILCTISGKLRTNYIRIVAGDNVMVEMSPYDITRGRIKWRDRGGHSTTVSRR